MGAGGARSIAPCARIRAVAAPVIHHSKPVADILIDAALVRGLLRAQHPDLAELPLQEVESGWDNAMFRLGAKLAVRLPRRIAVATLIDKEQGWLPQLAPFLPIPVPAPVRTGQPGDSYPSRWSIVPWSERAEQIAERIRRLELHTRLLNADVKRIYEAAMSAPIDVAPTWLHADLHPGNLLVDDGIISGVIDWGDMARGDRATDLATIWMNLSDRKARENAMCACDGVSDATWLRAKGWAIFFGVTLGTSGLAGDARHAVMARRTLERVVDGP
jgi:aminoglycoside phosphotransferase (APT) family kinase protein